MNTRSKTNYENNAPYSVNIDFDDASESWKSNKKRMGNGCYTYISERELQKRKKQTREVNDDFHKNIENQNSNRENKK